MYDTRTGNGEGMTLWLTGLSGAGKSTLARAVAGALSAAGRRVEVLDGDELRGQVALGLGFSREDRNKNVALLAYIARLLSRNGVIAIVAAISPYRDGRDAARLLHDGRFVEVFVDCALDVLIDRDPKGLYARALRGDIPLFTGISDPYEAPPHPEVHVRTDRESVDQSAQRVLDHLRGRGFITP